MVLILCVSKQFKYESKIQFHKEEAKIVQLCKHMHQKFPEAAQIVLISEVQ